MNRGVCRRNIRQLLASPDAVVRENGVFETLFSSRNIGALQLDARQQKGIEALVSVQYKPGQTLAPFELNVEAEDRAGNLEMVFAYSTQLFKRATIEEMAARYVEILRQVVYYPDMLLQDIEYPVEALLENCGSSLKAEEFGK
ncbi:MAG: hypothetical protein GY757_26795 [bacterium]|nr:hypothetical protein [bacterium]